MLDRRVIGQHINDVENFLIFGSRIPIGQKSFGHLLQHGIARRFIGNKRVGGVQIGGRNV